MRAAAALACLALAACAGSPAAAPPDEGTSLFDGRTLGSWASVEFGGEGKPEVKDGMLVVPEGAGLSGVVWKGTPPPATNYELSWEAQRVDGTDFFSGVAFPVGKDFCSFVAGGWGGSLVGLSSLDGMNASENETQSAREFKRGRWYRFRLRVEPERIRAWIDDEAVVDVEIKGKKVSIHPAMEMACPLGLTTYATTGAFRAMRLRALK